MRPEGGEAETSQPTPEEETPEGEEHETVGRAVPFSSVLPLQRTALSSAQLSPTTEGAQRVCTTGIWIVVGSESGSSSVNPGSSGRQVAISLPFK